MRLYRYLWILALALLMNSSSATSAQDTTSSPNDVTEHVTLVGNPFTEAFPSGEWVFARNVWDMQVFDGRLYLGHGNSNASGPAVGAGPIDVWSYDAADDTFTNEYTVDEEEIEHYVILDGTLYIPGHDPKDGWALGNFYRLVNNHWQKWRTIPSGVHTYDMTLYNGRLYAALGVDGNEGHVIAVSDDLGSTWSTLRIPPFEHDGKQYFVFRAYQFFEVNGELLVSIMPPNELTLRADGGSYDQNPLRTEVQRVTDTGLEDVDVDFFAPFELGGTRYQERRIARPVRFVNQTVYIGGVIPIDHDWIPLGLFSVSDAFAVTNYPFTEGTLPWDVEVDDDTLYVLLSQESQQGTIVSVQATCDLSHWREVLRFQASTFARSFSFYNGDWYFGLGTLTNTLSPDTGNILRVDHEQFEPGCGA